MNGVRLIASLLFLVLCLTASCSAYAQERNIVVIIPSYNNAKWYQRNLDSVFAQKEQYDNFRIIYIEDCWSVGSGLVQQYKDTYDIDNRMTLICNSERRGAMANVHYAVHLCDDNEIVVMLDGDDWFADNGVLSLINNCYEDPNVWLTYGSYREEPLTRIYQCKTIPNTVIQKNSYRSHRWEAQAVRTFYAWLFKRIKQEDFMYEGQYLVMTHDMAYMFPLLEMSGGRFKMVDRLTYIYNRLNPINDDKVNRALQYKLEKYIRALPRYAPLAPVYLHRAGRSMVPYRSKGS